MTAMSFKNVQYLMEPSHLAKVVHSIDRRVVLQTAGYLFAGCLFVLLAQPARPSIRTTETLPDSATNSAAPTLHHGLPVARDALDSLDDEYKAVDARSPPAEHCRVTKSDFSNVHLGANYAEVVRTFGCAGTLKSSELVEGITFHVFAWNNGKVLTLFVNRKLSIASQSDL